MQTQPKNTHPHTHTHTHTHINTRKKNAQLTTHKKSWNPSRNTWGSLFLTITIIITIIINIIIITIIIIVHFFFYFSVNLISLNWIEALLPRFFCFIFPNFLLASGEAEVTFQLLSSRSQRQVSLFSLILCLSSRSQRQVSLFSRLFIFPPTPCLWVLALNARCHSFFPFFFVLNEKKKDEEEEDDENIFVNQFRYRKQKKIIRKETKKNPILK